MVAGQSHGDQQVEIRHRLRPGNIAGFVLCARLEEHLVPKRPEAADADRIRSSDRGIAHTRTAFAYLFQAT